MRTWKEWRRCTSRTFCSDNSGIFDIKFISVCVNPCNLKKLHFGCAAHSVEIIASQTVRFVLYKKTS